MMIERDRLIRSKQTFKKKLQEERKMIYQEGTTVEQDVVTPMATAKTHQAELSGHVLNQQQKRNGGLMIGYLHWQPETNQVQLHLEVNSKFMLILKNNRPLPASEGNVEPWWLPANMTQFGHEAHETTMQRANPGVYFDEVNSQFFIDDQPIAHMHLTDIDWSLLEYLYKNMGTPCSYRDIAKHVWRCWVDHNTISQRIYTLRRKLKKISPKAKNGYIETIRGRVQGYMLIKPAL